MSGVTQIYFRMTPLVSLPVLEQYSKVAKLESSRSSENLLLSKPTCMDPHKADVYIITVSA